MGYRMGNQKNRTRNITIGPPATATKLWCKNIKEMKQKAQDLNHKYVTYDLKAVMSKTIFTLYFIHFAHTYQLPKQKHEAINTIIAQYVAGYHDPLLEMSKLSKSKEEGGYNFSYIPLYTDHTYIKPLTEDLRYKIKNGELPAHLKHIQYNIGLHLSNIFQLPRTHNTPHAAFLSVHYKNIIEEGKKTKEGILKGQIMEIYI